ncbi:MAG TPA: hypothetical protein PKO06_17870, partial [Candidatus Ozemobacteraceae bacterium]|nr:hypothetical protein [Candidatus Ozemobacteraceae bacterium]
VGYLANQSYLEQQQIEQQRLEARQKCSDLIRRLQGQTTLTYLVEDAVERLLRESYPSVTTARTPAELTFGAERFLTGLASIGFRVHRSALYATHRQPLGSGSHNFSVCFRTGYAPEAFDGLDLLIAYATMEGSPFRQRVYEKIGGMNNSLGFPATPDQFYYSYHGRVRPVLGSDGPAWFFWQKLSHSPMASSGARLGMPLSRQFVRPPGQPPSDGILLTVFERGNEGQFFAPLLIAAHRDPEIALAVLPTDQKVPLYSSSFPDELKHLIGSDSRQTIPSDWIVMQGELAQPYAARIITAVNVPVRRRWATLTLECLLLISFLGAACLVWYAALQHEAALGRSLSAQIWWGCLIGVLIPLTLAATLGTRFMAGEEGNERERRRQHLRHTLDTLDERLIWHQNQLIASMTAWTSNPDFQRGVMNRKRDDLYHYYQQVNHLSQTTWPLFDLQEILCIYPHQESLTITSPGKPNLDAVFSRVLGLCYRDVIHVMNPTSVASATDQGTVQAARDEIVARAAIDIMRSIFGPDVYFQMLFGAGNPMLFAAGLGAIVVHHFLIPSPKSPVALAAWFFDSRQTYAKVGYRLRGLVDDTTLQGACLTGGYGMQSLSFEHRPIPDLVLALRRTIAAQRSQSLTISSGDEPLLMETRLGNHAADTIGWAVSPAAVVNRHIAQLRR